MNDQNSRRALKKMARSMWWEVYHKLGFHCHFEMCNDTIWRWKQLKHSSLPKIAKFCDWRIKGTHFCFCNCGLIMDFTSQRHWKLVWNEQPKDYGTSIHNFVVDSLSRITFLTYLFATFLWRLSNLELNMLRLPRLLFFFVDSDRWMMTVLV